MALFAAYRPDPADVAAVDWPRDRGGVRRGYVPLDLVAQAAGVRREAAYKLARRCAAEGRVRLYSLPGVDVAGRKRRRAVVSEADGAYLVAAHRGVSAPAPTELCPAGRVLVSEVARRAGVHRSATIRLAQRHGIPLRVERGRDSRGRARRRRVVSAAHAERLVALHRARRARRPESGAA